ncbi:hypothetical protein U1Q18_013622 [Sarracenia purpurea var. burkii]
MGRRVRCSTARGGFAVTASRQRWSRVVARRRDGGARLWRHDDRCGERWRRRCARDERRCVQWLQRRKRRYLGGAKRLI